jgi:drug/metabolite transporter (DMT)-like permease
MNSTNRLEAPAFSPRVGIIIAVLALSVPAIFIRLAQADSLSIAFLRLAFAALLLWPFTGRQVLPALKNLTLAERWRVVAAGAGLGIHLMLWITSVKLTTIASASFLVICQPILVAIIAHFLLKERLNRWVNLALLLTLIGSALINMGDLTLSPEYLRGDFLALLAAIMAALYIVAARSVRREIRLLPYITVLYSVAALVVLPITLLAGAPLFTLSGSTYFWCLMLALIPTLIGHSLFNWALRYLKAFTVNSSIVVEPLVATLLAWMIFQEKPSPWLYPGAILLVLALIISFKGEEA